jgi:hypothetical protein
LKLATHFSFARTHQEPLPSNVQHVENRLPPIELLHLPNVGRHASLQKCGGASRGGRQLGELGRLFTCGSNQEPSSVTISSLWHREETGETMISLCEADGEEVKSRKFK